MFRQRNSFNKYRAQSCHYEGILYHSKMEAAYAAELNLRQKAGEITSWSRQLKLSLDVNGYHIANYYVDFLLEYPDGIKEIVEVKGFETDVWKMKWKLCEALYSDKYRMIVVK